MKNRIKQILAMCCACALSFVMIGCDGGSKLRLVDDVNTDPVYLSFFSLGSLSDNDVTKFWSDRFTEQYNKRVYINYESADYYSGSEQTYRELLVRRLESSSPDDLYIINAEDVLEFEKKGYWLDLSDMDFVDNLSDAALYQSTHNGKVFSLPLSYTGFGFVWNIDMLSRLNLTIPQNLDEFKAVCAVLKANGILPYGANKGFALTVPAMSIGLNSLYSSENLNQQIDALNNGAPIGDHVESGFEFLEWMLQNGYMDGAQALNSTPREDDVKMFLNGECGFICSGLGDLRSHDVPFEWRQTGLPLLSGGSVAVYGANNRLCVNPDTKNLAAVRDFVEMIGTPDALAKSAAMDNAMSCAKVDNTPQPDEESQLITLLRSANQIPNQDFALHFNTWENIRDVARTLCSGGTVQDACALLNEKQLDDLANYGNIPLLDEE